MGKIIGVLNQKGGVGKSTLTSLLSSNIHIAENKKRENDFVAVFDGDYPQHTIKNIRDAEQAVLKDTDENGNSKYYLNKYFNVFGEDLAPMKIYTGQISDLDKTNLDKLRKKHEYTFVDTTGTLNVSGYDQVFLSLFDYIIIPTNIDYEVFRSTISFVKNVIQPLKNSKKLDYHILFNNIDSREKKKAQEIQAELQNVGLPVLDTILYRRKKYITLYVDDNRGGVLSTLYPKHGVSINNIINEIKNNLNK